MLYRDICKLLGTFFSAFSVILFIPLVVGLYYEFLVPHSLHPQPQAHGSFLLSFAICLSLGLLFKRLGRHSLGHLHLREGLASVALIWLLLPVMGGLPFYLSDTLPNPMHAYFEGVASFTTTGTSMIHAKNYDPLPIKKFRM